MSFHIIRNDITSMKVDAIVNAANNTLLGGGGVDGMIHRKAGPELKKECEGLGGCPTGEAKATKGYGLPAKYVIHTVGPVWRGGAHGERQLLASCYDRSLALAKELNCESIAFPLISGGIYGYPREEAIRVAQERIIRFLEENEMEITLVIYARESFNICAGMFPEIEEYIDDRYVEEHTTERDRSRRAGLFRARAKRMSADFADLCGSCPPENTVEAAEEERAEVCDAEAFRREETIEEMLKRVDESFSQKLLRLITESGMKDSECYKKANIDRRLFSKIRSDVHYKPSKRTVLAFAIALRLSLRETKELLRSAGFALSPSDRGDLIVQFFIERGKYDVFEINDVLFHYDQALLGA